MVFRNLFKAKGKKSALPCVGDAALGRALRIDQSMLQALIAELGHDLDADFIIVAQGIAELPGDGGSSWLHRFYDDDDRMLQVMTESETGGIPEEWSFYVPAHSAYLARDAKLSDWRTRLEAAQTEFNGSEFQRIWYEGDTSAQEAVRFHEKVCASPDDQRERIISQECMLYGRERAEGEVLLLDMIMEVESQVSFERMLGTGLRDHHISI